MGDSVPIYLIGYGKSGSSVHAGKAMSLQIRPDFSKFSFNPSQVIGCMELNWTKKKPKTIHKFSFPTPGPLSLPTGLPSFCMQSFWGEGIDIGNFFFFFGKYRRCDLFVKKRLRVSCSKQKHIHELLVCFSTWPTHHINSGLLERVFTYEDGMFGAVLLLEGTNSNQPSFVLI